MYNTDVTNGSESVRAASDLEESGLIDKNQKGLIKDLIISGDISMQNMLEKYSRGDTKELEGNQAFSTIVTPPMASYPPY